MVKLSPVSHLQEDYILLLVLEESKQQEGL